MRKFTVVQSATADSSVSASVAEPMRLIEPVKTLIGRFPTTRYYGSKRRLLSWMYGHFGALKFDTVLDAFGGTASVSMLFKAMGKDVTYHDGFRFNEDVAKAVLAPRPALTLDTVAAVLESVEPRIGVISQNFEGVFFKTDENAWLDGFMDSVDGGLRLPDERSLLRYLVYQACLKKRPFNLFHRANLTLRTKGGVTRSFGNAVTWERSFSHHILQAHSELARAPVLHGGSVNILPAGDAGNIAAGYDLVYIDPPYINSEERYNRDDYWRRYHFLEGLARYNDWARLIDPASDVRMFAASAWFVEWGRKSTFKERLFSFIDQHKNSIVVLSYVSGAVPSDTEIMAHFENRFAQVSVHSAAHNHALSKTQKRELLFIGLPK